MSTFLFILVTLLILGLFTAPIVYLQIRKAFREQKNYERGLKMVPLLIQLPPTSDDTDTSNRDARDVAEENVSRAEVLYGIIASTWQKGRKNRFYGQRHFGFEIVASKGFVYFYAAVPVVLVEIVKQAIVSSYPSARVEEVPEHNIFNPIGKINATTGGELSLKENYAYPIATYQDIKRDAMQSLLNALSTLDKEDGVGIQILMRPANPSWTKAASAMASKKRKGKDDKKGGQVAGQWLKDLAKTAGGQATEQKSESNSGKPDLSSLEQSVLDSIDDKTRHPGYETLIRVVASSNVSQRAQAILSNVIAAFALYDAPGKNGFKYTPAKDIERFVTAYILRMFPQENTKTILNSVELATLFHFPDQKNIPTSQLERQASKQVDGPRNVPDEGLLLGYNIFRGVKKPIRLSFEDRQRHMYVVGQTGTGKSTFLENLALQDMLSGGGFCFVDPHGDTAEKLLSMVPKERTEDVIYFCPADMEYPMGLNLFEFDRPEQKDFLIQEAINMLYKLYDPQHQGIIGPRYESWFRYAALTLMSDPGGSTFIDIPKVFTDKNYAKQKLKYVTDQTVLDFWNKEMAATTDYHKSEVLGWFVSKFGAFLGNQMMRDIIGQTKSAFNLREIMDNKKILIVNLTKGRTGELNSKLLGMIFVMKFQAAAMSRSDVPESERVDFSLYVDEFQNFSTDSFATIMSEARKYHLNLIVANQFTTQLSEEIRDAVFGNMGTIVSFRVGQNDVESLTKYYQPMFGGDDLLRVPNYNTIVRTLIRGVPTQPFSMATLPPLGNPNPKLSGALKQLSAAKYGRPQAKVEAEIFERLATIEDPKPPPGAQMAGRPAPGGFGPGPAMAPPSAAGASAAAMAPPSPKPPASFLDDWLAKRQGPITPRQPAFGAKPAISPPVTPAPSPSPAPATQPVQPTASTPPKISHAVSATPPANTTSDKSINEPTIDTSGLESTKPPAPEPKPASEGFVSKPVAPIPVQPEPKAGEGTANISSNALQKDEINSIAKEIHKNMVSQQPKSEPAQNTPKQPPARAKEGELPLKQPIEQRGPNDTIVIDQDGTFHSLIDPNQPQDN